VAERAVRSPAELGLDPGAVGAEPFEVEYLVGQRPDWPLERFGKRMDFGGKAMEVRAAVGVDERAGHAPGHVEGEEIPVIPSGRSLWMGRSLPWYRRPRSLHCARKLASVGMT